ncbi:hypothetical protein SAMN04488552_0709 [Christiangramia echinicola]|uniref:Uncharacterized protein n=1 Tax=Christiangramia echinicola TaxID=279359 RepID=A0A1H1LCJ6_9FLAO|nr:hypothetical protein SAMN04488552_0709 [Christiangramia echinicola]
MENKFLKSISIVLIVVLVRSFYLQQEFYYKMWEENQLTILFLGLLFVILILMAIRFQKFSKVNND